MSEYNAQTQGFDSPYRFNGKELDQETGLAYYGARYYDNKISTWLSVDPLAMDESNVSKTPYHFTSNNPVMRVDPDGMNDHLEVTADGTIVGGEMNSDKNIYVVERNEDGTYSRTGAIYGQLMNEFDGFKYIETGGFETTPFDIGEKIRASLPSSLSEYDCAQEALNSLNQEWENRINGTGKGYMRALSELAVFSRGTKGLGPFDGPGRYDIKNTMFGQDYTGLYEYSPGVFTTPRTMGNMLFGANVRSIFEFRVNALDTEKYNADWFLDLVMNRAGSYNESTNGTTGNDGFPCYNEHQGSCEGITRGYYEGL